MLYEISLWRESRDGKSKFVVLNHKYKYSDLGVYCPHWGKYGRIDFPPRFLTFQYVPFTGVNVRKSFIKRYKLSQNNNNPDYYTSYKPIIYIYALVQSKYTIEGFLRYFYIT
jgi:hypothetical protein